MSNASQPISLGAQLQDHIRLVCQQLEQADLSGLARRAGFLQRLPRKIPILKLVLALVALAAETVLSLERVAAVIGAAAGTSYSKQTLHRRLGVKMELFLAQVATTLLKQFSLPVRDRGWFTHFQRVLVHDSTVEPLPEALASAFPGAKNAHRRKPAASLKLQFACDLLHSQVLHVSLSGFTRNDQAAAPDILNGLRRGDLVIRDLGYFVSGVFAAIAARGAFFLSRFRQDVRVYDAQTGAPLDLAALLGKNRGLDRPVLLGAAKIPVRLVAQPVPEGVANERRRKARANRDRRLNPSSARLHLLGWNIFVTNVSPEVWPLEALQPIYRLRWRIEMIFEAWKSYLRLRELNCRTADLVRLSAMTKLLFCIATYRLSDVLEFGGQATESSTRHVSLLRLARILGQCACWFAATVLGMSLEQWLELHLSHHLFYEARKDRKNFYELFLEKPACLG